MSTMSDMTLIPIPPHAMKAARALFRHFDLRVSRLTPGGDRECECDQADDRRAGEGDVNRKHLSFVAGRRHP
jgi:hypothetical protein